MKKTLKTVVLCCLFTAIGVVIGSSSKKLLGGSVFSNVNSSPKKVVENYITARYYQDKEIMEQCLSPDLNDIEMLKYFNERGGIIAGRFLGLYSKYLQYKENPPEDFTKEEIKVHMQMMNKIENKEFVDIFVDSAIKYVQEIAEEIGHVDGVSMTAELVGEEEQYLSVENADTNYMGMTFYLTSNNQGEISADDEYIVIQKKLGKYYIVDLPSDLY